MEFMEKKDDAFFDIQREERGVVYRRDSIKISHNQKFEQIANDEDIK